MLPGKNGGTSNGKRAGHGRRRTARAVQLHGSVAPEHLREYLPPLKLVYVDGGSPGPVRRWLKSESLRRGFRLVRTEHYLVSNEARNLALRYVDTRYVVFIENDVVVAPGWLDALVRCAEETGASLVGPLYCIGQPEFHTVHMAGGISHFEQRGDQRTLVEKHRMSGEPVAAVLPRLGREAVELVEFHCALARREVFDRLGTLDERLRSSRAHADLCLTVRKDGGAVYFEPASQVTYVPPPPLEWSDVPFYLLRWSEEWTLLSVGWFAKKWDLSLDEAYLKACRRGTAERRAAVTTGWIQSLQRLVGWRAAVSLARSLEQVLTSPLIPQIRRRRRSVPVPNTAGALSR